MFIAVLVGYSGEVCVLGKCGCGCGAETFRVDLKESTINYYETKDEAIAAAQEQLEEIKVRDLEDYIHKIKVLEIADTIEIYSEEEVGECI